MSEQQTTEKEKPQSAEELKEKTPEKEDLLVKGEEGENVFSRLPEEELPSFEDLLKAGVHFGHQKGRWHPNAASYIYGERSNVHIINLKATRKGLEKALAEVRKIIDKKGTILFLGTKKQIQKLVKQAAEETQMPYVCERWLGGTFTNFPTIKRRVDKLLEIEKKFQEGGLSHYTKKERAKFKKELGDFEKNMGGLRNLKELPKAIFVVGAKEENTAIREAKRTGVKIIAIADTNIDPKDIDFPIPGNDDAVKSVQLILSYFVKEIKR